MCSEKKSVSQQTFGYHVAIFGQSHKWTVEQFAQAVSNREILHLNQFLENDVQKTLNSKVIYNNIQEAQEYYTKEQQSHPKAPWKVSEYYEDDSKSNTLHGRV